MTSSSTSSTSSGRRQSQTRGVSRHVSRPVSAGFSRSHMPASRSVQSHQKQVTGLRLSDLTSEQQERVLKARQQKQRVAKKGKDVNRNIKVFVLIVLIVSGVCFAGYVVWQRNTTSSTQQIAPSSLATDYDALYPGGVLSDDIATSEEYNQDTKTLVYKDVIGDTEVTVTQSLAPDEYRSSPEKMRKYIEDEGFKYRTVASTPETFLIDANEIDMQLVVLIKGELLVIINTEHDIDDQALARYVASLL